MNRQREISTIGPKIEEFLRLAAAIERRSAQDGRDEFQNKIAPSLQLPPQTWKILFDRGSGLPPLAPETSANLPILLSDLDVKSAEHFVLHLDLHLVFALSVDATEHQVDHRVETLFDHLRRRGAWK